MYGTLSVVWVLGIGSVLAVAEGEGDGDQPGLASSSKNTTKPTSKLSSSVRSSTAPPKSTPSPSTEDEKTTDTDAATATKETPSTAAATTSNKSFSSSLTFQSVAPETSSDTKPFFFSDTTSANGSPTTPLPVPESTSPDSASPLTASTSAAAPVALAASSPNTAQTTRIAVGVVVPLVLIALAALGVVLFKRRQRRNDRREWERTHEAIAEAVRVRQGGGGVAGGSTTTGGSASVWSGVELVSRPGGIAGASLGERDPFASPIPGSPFSDYHRAWSPPTLQGGHMSPVPASMPMPMPPQQGYYRDEPETDAESLTAETATEAETESAGHYDPYAYANAPTQNRNSLQERAPSAGEYAR
ncbi:hypothetical protein MKEN_01111000 [Mycena kentingensis (nom. inval.)]|nr:hypothetical protein MKEN_01111000 [Mycena kentingensis (nom. inval.)]